MCIFCFLDKQNQKVLRKKAEALSKGDTALSWRAAQELRTERMGVSPRDDAA